MKLSTVNYRKIGLFLLDVFHERLEIDAAIKKGIDLGEVAPVFVEGAFRDVADHAGKDLLRGRLPHGIFRFRVFGHKNAGDVLNVGRAIAALRPDKVQRIIAVGLFGAGRE